MGQKILTLSRILTKCFKWSENGQKIRTKSENAAEDSEEETNTIMLTLCNTLTDMGVWGVLSARCILSHFTAQGAFSAISQLETAPNLESIILYFPGKILL